RRPLPPGSLLFPYTTLFRSRCAFIEVRAVDRIRAVRRRKHRFLERAASIHGHWAAAEQNRRACNGRIAGGVPDRAPYDGPARLRPEEHTSELQSRENHVCRR